MRCPKDQTTLRKRERGTSAGVVFVLDVCPTCGGIWLDKGELERFSVAEGRYYLRRHRDREEEADRRSFDQRGGRWGRRGFLGRLFGRDDH
ncbi:MAG: zf-TFIIB domain-containing protein [Dehalococcoidia bacterium]|nr:zf-TFIIB domain-containing protein [Dehalococcoidia bacterium]